MAGKCLELTFNKRVCYRYIASRKNDERCACGQVRAYHTSQRDKDIETEVLPNEVWNPTTHTVALPTDAFGTIDFHDGAHPNKAQYIRLAHDSPSDRILQLLTRGWGLELPKLVISVHGGKANFDLSPRLKKVIQTGLLRAAKTTGAWLFTGGTNSGVTQHVGDALISERSPRLRSGRVVSIGIAPWGVIENRHSLVGNKKDVPYVSIDHPRSKYAVLNNRHAYFLLVDNGTIGHSGAEISLRRKLEKYISSQLLPVRTHCSIPVVCVVIEGGVHTIHAVLEYVTDTPPVPVVVCEGSGRAADLIAYACKYVPGDEEALATCGVKDQLLAAIKDMFDMDVASAETILSELLLCVKKKNLITIFSSASSTVVSEESDEEHSLDQAILTSIFTSRHLSSPNQLSLAIAWNRVDIARSEIFVYGQEWPEGALEEAMMDALDKNRVDFVHLLLDKGVQITKFLTISRLEELYNSKQGPVNTLRYIVRDVRPHMPKNYNYTLVDIGLVINKLMGGAYRSLYTKRKFRHQYNELAKISAVNELSAKSLLENNSGRNGQAPRHESANMSTSVENTALLEDHSNIFKQPFNDLLTWAVLTKRQAMAHLMWQHGEQALAKALIASKLYRAMADEAAGDDLDVEISDELRKYAKEFEDAAIELLDYCYRGDDELARQLLTCELVYWNRQNCLRLAHACNHRAFLAHPCSQMILSDLWMGGLRSRRWTNVKVFLCWFLPPIILRLDFKSIEELQLMPQTMEEHMLELKEENAKTYDDASSLYSSSSSFSTNSSKSSQSKSSRGSVFGGYVNTINMEDTAGSKDEMVLQNPSNVYESRKEQRQLKAKKKFHEFYTAPISKFWCHSIAYLAFLLIYTYTLLIKLPEHPEWNEYYVIAYIVTFGCEIVRDILASEPIQLRQKLWVWLHSRWNVCDAFFVLEFLLGLILRLYDQIDHGRVLYCLNIIYWYTRILRIFMVSKFLGPFVVIIGRMVYSMMRFVALMVVNIMAYGVFRQTLLYPDEQWSWHLVRDIFYQPYFMIFGEEFVDEIDPPCGPDQDVKECVAGRWLNPVVMAIYLLLTYILLVNLLIAVFNSIFAKAHAISRQIWKSSRFVVIMEYERKPILPSPLIFISHIFLLVKWCQRWAKGKQESYDQGLTLFLSEGDLERLYDFEEECMEGLAQEKESKLLSSAEERTRLIGERLEGIGSKVTECLKLFSRQNRNLKTIGYRIMKMEAVAKKIHVGFKNFCQSADPSATNSPTTPQNPHCNVIAPDDLVKDHQDGHQEIRVAPAVYAERQTSVSSDEDVDQVASDINSARMDDVNSSAHTQQSPEDEEPKTLRGTSPSEGRVEQEVNSSDDEKFTNDQHSSNTSSSSNSAVECEVEFADVFDESDQDEQDTIDSSLPMPTARSLLVRRSCSVEQQPKLRKRVRNFSEASYSPPRNRSLSVMRRKSLQILSQEKLELNNEFLSGQGAASAGSPNACVNCQITSLKSAELAKITAPQLLPTKPKKKSIPLAKIEAEAEHLREMEGRDYELMESVIQRRMRRDSGDLCASVDETVQPQKVAENEGADSNNSTLPICGNIDNSDAQFLAPGAGNGSEIRQRRQTFTQNSWDQPTGGINTNESDEKVSIADEGRTYRPPDDIKIDVDDDSIE